MLRGELGCGRESGATAGFRGNSRLPESCSVWKWAKRLRWSRGQAGEGLSIWNVMRTPEGPHGEAWLCRNPSAFSNFLKDSTGPGFKGKIHSAVPGPSLGCLVWTKPGIICNLLSSPTRIAKLPSAAESVKWANRDTQRPERLDCFDLSGPRAGSRRDPDQGAGDLGRKSKTPGHLRQQQILSRAAMGR